MHEAFSKALTSSMYVRSDPPELDAADASSSMVLAAGVDKAQRSVAVERDAISRSVQALAILDKLPDMSRQLHSRLHLDLDRVIDKTIADAEELMRQELSRAADDVSSQHGADESARRLAGLKLAGPSDSDREATYRTQSLLPRLALIWPQGTRPSLSHPFGACMYVCRFFDLLLGRLMHVYLAHKELLEEVGAVIATVCSLPVFSYTLRPSFPVHSRLKNSQWATRRWRRRGMPLAPIPS
jgi:hypothetical protein